MLGTMITSLLIISVIIPIIAFFFEIYPRLINKKIGVDIWTHLLYLKEYKKQRGIPNYISDGFIIPGGYDYPPMFITLLSKFSIRIVEKYEFLFSPFFDFIHLVAIFFITYVITGDLAMSLLTQVLYSLTPIIILENSSATPRSLGYLLFTLLFFSIFNYTNTGSELFLLLAFLFGSLILLTHRFTTQGFLIYSIVFSLVELDPIYVGIFLGSFLGAIIISRGFYLKVLAGHIGNLKFWYKNIEFRFFHQIKGDYKSHKSSDFVFKIYNQFINIPPVVLTVTNPWILFVFLSMLFYLPLDALLQRLLLWIMISYVLALVTIWIKKLRFLGEGQRYLELSAFPSALLAARFILEYQVDNFSFSIYGLAAIVGISSLVTIIVIQRKAIIKDRLRTLIPELEDMYLYIKKMKKKPRILCIPHQITTNTIFHTGAEVFVNANYRDIEKISEAYPFFRVPIKRFMKKHKLDLILLNEEYAKISDLKIRGYKELKRFGNIVLLSI